MKILARSSIPVFPLPNVVLYPRIVLPLYIFEPRYRKMLFRVLDGHGMIAVALLKPGWEPEYHGYPDVHRVVTVGTILTYQTREDKTSDIVLVGTCRAQILEWAEVREYREARLVELAVTPPGSTSRGDQLRLRLKKCLARLTRDLKPGEDLDRLQKIFSDENDVGFLVDFVAYHFLDSFDEKQRLLEELDVERRTTSLFESLEKKGLI